MRITRVEPKLVALPYEHGAPKPVRKGIGSWDTQDILFVRVQTDEGIVGWGEAFGHASSPVTFAAIRDIVAPLAVDQDATDVTALMSRLTRRTQSMARSGPVQFALSGLDIALWDIAGKATGKPVWQMLGGEPKPRLAAYASLFRLNTVEHVQRVASAAAARGYRHVKLHEHTVETVAAAREAVGPDVSLMIDTNCYWDSVDAVVAFCTAVEHLDIAWLEEPLYPADSYDVSADVRSRVKIPIAAGENLGNFNDARWLAAAGAVDIVQPSVPKIGGITGSWRTMQFLRSSGLRVVLHSPFVGPALVAAIHLTAASPDGQICEHRFCDLGANPLGGAAVAVDGWLTVPEGPGLGIEVDESVVESYRIA